MSKSSKQDLEAILKSFKNYELMKVLKYAKISCAGNKADLLKRSIELVKKNKSKLLESFIRTEASKIVGDKIANKTTIKSNFVNMLDTPKLLDIKFVDVFKNVNEQIGNNLNTHFKSLVFYNFIEDIVPTKPLVFQPRMMNSQKHEIGFYLSNCNIDSILESKVMINDCIEEYQTQVLLRFCTSTDPLNLLKKQDCADNFPSVLSVFVNGIPLKIPFSETTLKNAGKANGNPLNITHSCNLDKGFHNKISITWNDIFFQQFYTTVQLAKKLNIDTLIEKLKSNHTNPPELTKTLVKSKLAESEDGDNEIATTSLHVSLVCPLGKIKMINPCKSNVCNHLQCFDAQTYIEMNKKKEGWLCPVCNLPASYETLAIDGLFVEILSENNSSNDIEFFADGSWSFKEKKKLKVEAKTIENNNIVCDTIEDSSSHSESDNVLDTSTVNISNSFIDLCDSSDDIQIDLVPKNSKISSLKGKRTELGTRKKSKIVDINTNIKITKSCNLIKNYSNQKNHKPSDFISNAMSCIVTSAINTSISSVTPGSNKKVVLVDLTEDDDDVNTQTGYITTKSSNNNNNKNNSNFKSIVTTASKMEKCNEYSNASNIYNINEYNLDVLSNHMINQLYPSTTTPSLTIESLSEEIVSCSTSVSMNIAFNFNNYLSLCTNLTNDYPCTNFLNDKQVFAPISSYSRKEGGSSSMVHHQSISDNSNDSLRSLMNLRKRPKSKKFVIEESSSDTMESNSVDSLSSTSSSIISNFQ